MSRLTYLAYHGTPEQIIESIIEAFICIHGELYDIKKEVGFGDKDFAIDMISELLSKLDKLTK